MRTMRCVCGEQNTCSRGQPELELEGDVGVSYILINTKLKYSVTHNFWYTRCPLIYIFPNTKHWLSLKIIICEQNLYIMIKR